MVQRKPGALRNGAPFSKLPPSFRTLQACLLKRPGGDREMADILVLALHHDEQVVEQAVREAVASGAVSRPHILNRSSRLLDAALPATLQAPPALTLTQEPRANTARYDHLQEDRHVGG